MFRYIFDGKHHTDTSRSYMIKLGMPAEAIESVLRQYEFEKNQVSQLKLEAYNRESDSLYMDWQKELALKNPDEEQYKQRWLDKVEDIKQRFTA